MSKLNTGLSAKATSSVCELLNTLLADETVLYVKTRNYHWNVVGPNFNDLHKFFESQYDALSGSIDDIAERVKALGGVASGSLKEYVASTRLQEQPGKQLNSEGMIENLLKDHEALIRHLRHDAEVIMDKFGDAGTNDFYIGLMQDHEKMAWMLRSMLG